MRTMLKIGLLLPALCGAALAQAGPTGGPGVDPVPLDHGDTIALTRADVTVTDGVQTTYPSVVKGGGRLPLHNVEYRGEYTLKNLSRTEQTVHLGIPVVLATLNAGTETGGIEELEVRGPGGVIKHDMLSREVKGTIFAVQSLSRAAQTALLGAGLARTLEGDPTLVDLAPLGRDRKTVADRVAKLRGLDSAQRKQLVETVVRHHLEPDDLAVERVAQQQYTFAVRLPPSATWTIHIRYRSPRGDERLLRSAAYSFSHVMRTGARWAGSIQRYRLNLVLETRRPWTDYSIRPTGYRRAGAKRVVFEHRNFEPRDDLVVRVRARP